MYVWHSVIFPEHFVAVGILGGVGDETAAIAVVQSLITKVCVIILIVCICWGIH